MPPAFVIFGQLVEYQDIAIVALLVVLEGVLSIDNALVLGVLAKRLPRHQQRKALTYGLAGAFIFRFIAIALAAYLFRWWIVKLLGGLYLIYISVKHFVFEQSDEGEQKLAADADGRPELLRKADGAALSEEQAERAVAADNPIPMVASRRHPGFWPTVGAIELTDIAFAMDSILAAIALVGSPPPGFEHDVLHPKFWVVMTGGFLGVIAMRYAAVLFIRLLEAFPRFETAAYLLVLLIGCKLFTDWMLNKPGKEPVANFHSPHSVAFWVFWSLMVVFFCTGFWPQRKKQK